MTENVCRHCDHWAENPASPDVGLCVEPESPHFHERRANSGAGLHWIGVGCCPEFLDIPEARGLDRRSRDGAIDA